MKKDQILLSGHKVKCKMCGWNGKRFPNSRCPKCRSLARTRLIPFSINFFDVDLDNINLLHVAPNISEYNFIKVNFQNITYDRLDIVNRDKINLVRDLTNTKLQDFQYDLIIIWHVLEHIPNDIKAIEEMYRILKKKGQVLVSVPIHPKGNPITEEDKSVRREDFRKFYGHPDHCRSCGLDYYKRFEEVGFDTLTLDTSKISETDRKKFGLSNSHISWLFTKK